VRLTRILAILVVVLIGLVNFYEPCFGQGAIEINKNVYIVVVNKLSLLDIQKMPNVRLLIDSGSFGLMNVRGINGYTGAECFATINASNKAYASNISSQFYNLDDEHKELYENKVGSIDGKFSIANLEIGRLYNQNEDNKYSPYIGALGDSLHNKGLKTAVYGNSDTDEEIIRYASLIPMDSKGLIDYGNVDNILISDNAYPYGLKTDYDKILEEVKEVSTKASLIVVDTGDLARLDSYSNSLSNSTFIEKRETILKDIDNFIGQLVDEIDREKSLLMIISPNSSDERIDESKLSPIIIWGKDVKEGTIISSTTNQKGIVTNLDIAPTVASFLNIPMVKTSGNAIEYLDRDNAFDYIAKMNGRINLTSRVRSKTLTTYGIISIIIMLLVSTIVFLKLKIDNRIGSILEISLVTLYGLPLIFLLISLFNINNMIKFIISLVISISIFISISIKFNRKRLLYLLTFFYFILIGVDILTNDLISNYSVLSHDPIIGARYFGIGNEMVGLFLAVSMLSLGLLYSRFPKKAICLLIALILVILVGHPKLGANVGGLITFLSAVTYFGIELFNKRLNMKNIFIIGFSIALGIAIIGFIDVKFNPNTTHLGRTLIQISNEGFYIVENIIVRKLLMNIKLVGISFWTKVLLFNVIIHGILSIFHKDIFDKIVEKRVQKVYLSCIVGSIIGFIVNDSGLILSSIAINMITIFYLFLIVNNGVIYRKQEVD